MYYFYSLGKPPLIFFTSSNFIMVYIHNLTPVRIFLNELDCNEFSRIHRNGETSPLAKKVEVAQALAISSRDFTVPANKKEIARSIQVYRGYVSNVERKILLDKFTPPPLK